MQNPAPGPTHIEVELSIHSGQNVAARRIRCALQQPREAVRSGQRIPLDSRATPHLKTRDRGREWGGGEGQAQLRGGVGDPAAIDDSAAALAGDEGGQRAAYGLVGSRGEGECHGIVDQVVHVGDGAEDDHPCWVLAKLAHEPSRRFYLKCASSSECAGMSRPRGPQVDVDSIYGVRSIRRGGQVRTYSLAQLVWGGV